jgi:uncharacterized membrane protein YcaP (DUF421 family)
MNEYLLISLKTLLFLMIILVIIRIMGKRELGQLNVFDIIISFMISEIFSNAIADPKSNVLLALLPILIIFLVQMLISYLILKSKKIRTFIEDSPNLIIDNGKINYDEMKNQRYNISDLLQQVREQGIDDLRNISYAILESNGTLSVIETTNTRLKYPLPLISDGVIDKKVMKVLGIDSSWLDKELKRIGIKDIKEIFMGFIDKNDKLVVFSKKTNNIK